MLDHPWMVEMRAKRVNMARYLAKVWGWEESESLNAAIAEGGTIGGPLGGALAAKVAGALSQ
jgi:hypothetical protein